MIILGLVLIIVALLLGLLLVLGTQALDPIPLEILNQTYHMSPLALVIAGAVAMTLLWWGWALVRMGTRRRARRSQAAKEAARQAELDRAAQEKENQAKWERELRERQARESQAGRDLPPGQDPASSSRSHSAEVPQPERVRDTRPGDR
ncbi:MAG: hypothetical protein GX344_12290 [Intrasporangiaceae bacterium]|nr:hypothetical protein [Intrasporangiaceae bacterium]